jgi:transposase
LYCFKDYWDSENGKVRKADKEADSLNKNLNVIQQKANHCFDELKFSGNTFTIDELIDKCLNVFWWATFRKAKAAIKLHTLLDVKTSIPVFVYVTAASVHDVKGMDELTYETGGYYVMDRGYLDYERLYNIDQHQAFFVTRAKNNSQLKPMGCTKADKSKGVICDQRVILKEHYSYKSYPKVFRRIKFYDAEQNRTFVFLSNNLILPAIEIAMLYKYRWKIELFFKWIKQHLKIKSFWGTSINAVKTQVYIAIVTYTLVLIIKEKLKLKQSAYEILQILNVSLLDKTTLSKLFENYLSQDIKEQKCIN